MQDFEQIEAMLETYEKSSRVSFSQPEYLNLITAKIGLAIAKELRELRLGTSEQSEEEEFVY